MGDHLKQYSPRYNISREYENLVNELRVDKGFTLSDLSTKIGISKNLIWQISQGYQGPFTRSGKIKPWAEKLCCALNCEIADLFPHEICNPENRQKVMTEDQINDNTLSSHSVLLAKNEYIERIDILRKLIEVLDTLTQKEKEILITRFGIGGVIPQSLLNCSKIFSLSKERIRQIETKALRKLRHPVRMRKLKFF